MAPPNRRRWYHTGIRDHIAKKMTPAEVSKAQRLPDRSYHLAVRMRALEMTVSEVMTRDVVTCLTSDTLTDVMVMMTAPRIRHLPVMIEGTLAGMISIGNVVKNRLEEAQMEVDAMRHYVTDVD